MPRSISSLLLGLLLGSLVGLVFGWLHYPADARNRHLSDLAASYSDEYSVMIAAGYAAEGDAHAAMGSLSRLAGDDALSSLRETTERIIQTSSRGLDDIALLVQLAKALGQLSESMQPFLDARGEGS